MCSLSQRRPAPPLPAFLSAPSRTVTTRRSGTWRHSSLPDTSRPHQPGTSVFRGEGLCSGGRRLVPEPSPPRARLWGSHHHWVSVPSPRVSRAPTVCGRFQTQGRQALLAPAQEMDRKQACL